MKHFASICLLGLVVSLSSCDETEPAVYHPNLRMIFNIVEEFDANGSLRVEGMFGVGSLDSVETIGIVYTDGIEANGGVQPVTPVVGTHNITSISDMTLTEPSRYEYSFEVLINPDRGIDPNLVSHVFLALFIKTKEGKVYQAETEQFVGSKLKVVSVYPAFAKAGENVSIKINRQVKDGKITAAARYNSGESFPVKVSVNNSDLPIDAIDPEEFSHSTTLTVKMPAGIMAETQLFVNAGAFSVAAESKVKSTSRSFKFLTEKDRNIREAPLLFAGPDAIFFGGAAKEDVTPLQLAPDFWKYTISTNEWQSRADLPASAPTGGMSLYFNNKAWFGQPTNFYRYDLTLNTWIGVSEPSSTIRYDHTFSIASYVTYNNKIYFTHYRKEIEFGGDYYYNFWEFDPATQNYVSKEGYPGDSYIEPYMDQAALNGGLLHYFPGFEHWTYNPGENTWLRYADVAEDSDEFRRSEIKAFSYKNELYVVYFVTIRVDFLDQHTLRLLKYNPGSDSWERESDVPMPDQFNDFWVFSYDDNNVFLAAKGSTMAFYKIN